ncbi:MAG: hypothetical protein AAB438_03270 [Patescibacteria group bacterium]
MVLFIWTYDITAFGQLSLAQITKNFETENDTTLPPCFLERLTAIYKYVGSPKIRIDEKGSRFFPGKIFIKDSSALYFVVEEMAHSYQWKQPGGKFRMFVAVTGLSLKAFWRGIFYKKPKDSSSQRGRMWQHYSSFAYKPMKHKFWAFEYEAHSGIAPDMWEYLRSPCDTIENK